MPSPEGLSFSGGETTGETPREVNEVRGEKTIEQIEAEKRAAYERNKKADEAYFKLTGEHLPDELRIQAPTEEAPKAETPAAEAPAEEPAEEAPTPRTIVVETPNETIEVDASELPPEVVEEAKKEQKNNKAVKTAIRVGLGVGAVGAIIAAIIGNIIHPPKTEIVKPQEQNEQDYGAEDLQDDTEVEGKYGELTGIAEFDRSVTGGLDQYGDVGMTDTEKHTEADPYVGKFSQYSVAAPNDLAREYFGVEKFEDLSEENKNLCFQMSCYKQDFSAMTVLKVIDPEYQNMTFTEAVMKLRESDQSVKDEKIEMLREFFQNAKLDETTVGDLSKAMSSMPGAAEVTKWLETQADGTLVENEQEIKDIITSTHRYALDGHRPHEQTVATPDSAKVMEYTYQISETEEVTIMTLERCFNGFVVHKSTDVRTKQTIITVTFYGDKDKLDQKNTEAEKKNMGNEYTDERGIDEKVTPKTTEEQDKAGFKEMEEQKKQDEEKVKQDQAEAERQAEAEKKAAEEAKRVAEEKANKEAEEKAAKEAEEKQRQAAEEEQQRQAEEEARRKAQEEANKKAEEQKKAAEEGAKNDEQRDANDWASGEFNLN